MLHMGLLTNSLVGVGLKDLPTIANWAADHQITELEAGPTIPMDERVWHDVLAQGRVKIGTMIYCRNFISDDETEALTHTQALEDRIRFAPKVGVKKIVCSAGQKNRSIAGLEYRPEESLDASVVFFARMAEMAEKHDVQLCFEMCPWMWNISCAPNMWDELLSRLDSKRVGLCYDPSHLVWQMIDPYRVLKQYGSRIFHVHGKDTQIDRDQLDRCGILQNTKWWRHRLPGLGELSWSRIVDELNQIGYDDVISIEHEDPVWEGTEDKVKRGILIARDHIAQYI